MATTTVISLQRLAIGEVASSSSLTVSSGSSSVDATTVQFDTATSQVRVIVKDVDGRTIASDILIGSASKRFTFSDLGSTVTVEMGCLAGSAYVSATQSTGGIVEADDIAAGAVTSDEIAAGAVGTAEIADDAITNDHIADASLSGAKFADETVEFWHLSESAAALGTDVYSRVSDPGDAGTIVSRNTYGGHFEIFLEGSGVPETRTMGAGRHVGQTCTLKHSSGAGNIVVSTDSDGWTDSGDDEATMATGTTLIMVCVGGIKWRKLAQDGVTFA
jgi:hypothetical protein